MALTDTAIRNAKARERDYKLGDGGGLYLLVTRSGGRLWRLKYRADGVERKLSIGKYPAVSLSDARKARDAARHKASAGDDPAAAKRRERVKAKLAAGTTFGARLGIHRQGSAGGPLARNAAQTTLDSRLVAAGRRSAPRRSDRASRTARGP